MTQSYHPTIEFNSLHLGRRVFLLIEIIEHNSTNHTKIFKKWASQYFLK